MRSVVENASDVCFLFQNVITFMISHHFLCFVLLPLKVMLKSEKLSFFLPSRNVPKGNSFFLEGRSYFTPNKHNLRTSFALEKPTKEKT